MNKKIFEIYFQNCFYIIGFGRYEWQTRGWSTCSEDCGGGVQKMIIRCYDSITGNRVQRKHCGVKRNRPRTEHRPCNTFQCEAEWVEGDWENCDQTCGKTGTQYRYRVIHKG